MKLLRSIKRYPEFQHGSVVAIGNFDGVHLGHQHLLAKLRDKAQRFNLPLVVVLFEPQAREFFQGATAPPRIYALRDKLQALQAQGVEYVLCLRFNKVLANTAAAEFVQTVLVNCLQARHLVVGKDFRFGKNRCGNLELLRNLAVDAQLQIYCAEDYSYHAQRISSTALRGLLQQGNFLEAKNLLGADYSLTGRVIKGAALARNWGFPTANLNISQRQLVLNGVYCVQVNYQGTTYLGVANLGRRPTFAGLRQLLEVHLLDFNGLLYGTTLQVFFIKKLRNEVKFASQAALIQQITDDVAHARNYFATYAHEVKQNDRL